MKNTVITEQLKMLSKNKNIPTTFVVVRNLVEILFLVGSYHQAHHQVKF